MCRESLWQPFEQMARELECSIDYLINESMKQYLRQRGYSMPASEAAPELAQRVTPPPLPLVNRTSIPKLPAPPPRPSALPPAAPPVLPPPTRRVHSPVAQPAVHLPPAPTPAPPPAPAGQLSPGVQLTVWFNNLRYVVTKDRFVIGRGKSSADIVVRDPNVSRMHAMVEFLNGQYYIVDMGSTNGIEYGGQRIARKAIAQHDIVYLCGHELRFVYETQMAGY